MANSTQLQRDRENLSRDRKSLSGLGREVSNRNRYTSGFVNIDVDIGRPGDWVELVQSVQLALNNVVQYLNTLTTLTQRYKDDEGRVLVGGLAEGAVQGMNLSPAVVDELQRIGDAIGANGCLEDGTFVSKTDDEYRKLHRT